MEYDLCDPKRLEMQLSLRDHWIERRSQLDPANEETKEEYDILSLSLEISKLGSTCSVTPKVKIQAVMSLFGVVYFIFALYTICRNIFTNRIE